MLPCSGIHTAYTFDSFSIFPHFILPVLLHLVLPAHPIYIEHLAAALLLRNLNPCLAPFAPAFASPSRRPAYPLSDACCTPTRDALDPYIYYTQQRNHTQKYQNS